jgi:hypothetical protein
MSRLKAKLQGVQASLDALTQGQVPITFTGYFGPRPALAPASTPAPTYTAPLTTGPGVPIAPPMAAEPSLPIFTALAKAFTVKDV